MFFPILSSFCLHQGCNISSQHTASSSAVCVCVCVCVCVWCVCWREGWGLLQPEVTALLQVPLKSLNKIFFCTFFLLSLSFLLYLSLLKSYSSLYSTPLWNRLCSLHSSLFLLTFTFHILFILQLSLCSLFLALSLSRSLSFSLSLFLALFFFGKMWAVKALFMNRVKK